MLLGPDGGATWTATFTAFSLNATKVEEGRPEVWDDPEMAPNLLAMELGIAVRDNLPDDFDRVHLALFTARHDDGLDLREEAVLRRVLTEQGVDAEKVFETVAGGGPRRTIRAEHASVVEELAVFGVPTVIAGDPPDAVFVRVMSRPDGDAALARRTVEQVLDLLVGCPDLNEFKHTRISQ